LVRQYQGQIESDQGAIDNAKLQLTYSRVTSPITGRVGLRQVDPGNIVHAAGHVLTIDNQIDTSTGTVKLKAEFPNQDGALFPNQFVNVRMLVETRQDATLVPSAAIQRGAPGTFVFLVKPDQSVAVTKVKVGAVEGDTTEVTSGLEPGSQVVVDGTDKLRDGAKVELVDANARQAGPTAGSRKGSSGKNKSSGGPSSPSPSSSSPSSPAKSGG